MDSVGVFESCLTKADIRVSELGFEALMFDLRLFGKSDEEINAARSMQFVISPSPTINCLSSTTLPVILCVFLKPVHRQIIHLDRL